jgi:transposase
MPRPHPPEFRQRAVELVRLRDKPVAQIARELGISDSCLRNWVKQADVDDGHNPGLSSDERAELVALSRKNRVLELKVEILKRASAYFARENVLPNDLHLHRRPVRRSQRLPRDEGVPIGVSRVAACSGRPDRSDARRCRAR